MRTLLNLPLLKSRWRILTAPLRQYPLNSDENNDIEHKKQGYPYIRFWTNCHVYMKPKKIQSEGIHCLAFIEIAIIGRSWLQTKDEEGIQTAGLCTTQENPSKKPQVNKACQHHDPLPNPRQLVWSFTRAVTVEGDSFQVLPKRVGTIGTGDRPSGRLCSTPGVLEATWTDGLARGDSWPQVRRQWAGNSGALHRRRGDSQGASRGGTFSWGTLKPLHKSGLTWQLTVFLCSVSTLNQDTTLLSMSNTISISKGFWALAQVTSNKMVHKLRYHFLAQFSKPFHMVCLVLLRVFASKTIE